MTTYDAVMAKARNPENESLGLAFTNAEIQALEGIAEAIRVCVDGPDSEPGYAEARREEIVGWLYGVNWRHLGVVELCALFEQAESVMDEDAEYEDLDEEESDGDE